MSDVPFRTALLALTVTVILVVYAVRQARDSDWLLSATLAVAALVVAGAALGGFAWFYRRRGRRERRPW